MEKVLKSVALFVVAILFASETQAQRVKYYYYPAANVYYNPIAGTYYYPNGAQWVTVKQLPANVSVKGKSKQVIYYTGNDVWNYKAVKVKSSNGKKKGWAKGKGNKH